MHLEENWAISPERVCDFFEDQPEIEKTPDGFLFHQCQIRLIPCSGMLLGKPQPRTILIMDGPESEVSQIYKRFFLRFLSAGG